MKKLIAMLLVLTMAMGLAACGVNNDNANAPASALEILETIWNSYAEADQFAISGGNMEYHIAQMEQDMNYQIPNTPLNYDLAYAESLSYTMLIPADDLKSIDQAATMTHLMNSNNFSCGAFHLTDGTDVEAFAKNVRDAIMNNHWMCGMPETLVIASFGGGYVLITYGINSTMTPFQNYLSQAYADAQILYKEAIVG